jgi:integrase
MARRTNIRRRGKSWCVVFRASGRQHWRSFKTREEAELFLAQAQADLARGSFRPPSQRLFEEFAHEWLRTHPSINPRTRELYDQRIREYLIPVLGSLKLAEITSDDVRRVRERASAAGRSGWTQKGILGTLSGILTYAVEQRLIAHNPVSTLPKRDRPRSKEGGRGPKRILTTDELRRLLASAGNYQALFAVAAFAGLRLSEVLALTWEDIDLDRGALHVHKQLSRPNAFDRTPPHRVYLKSDSDEGCERVVFLSDDLARLLRRHRGDRIPRRDEYVFVTSRGTPYIQRNIARFFDVALARAGITWRSKDDKPTFHSLRHGFASAIIAGGADQGHVARLLGHTDPAFTYRVYVHEFDRARRQAESKAALAAAFAGVV